VLAAVSRFHEASAELAMLGVGLELVLKVRDSTGGVTAMELERAVAIFAAELGVAVEQGVGEGLYLPEGLIPSTGAYASAFYFALK
jgi:hypothetical protein